MIIFSEEAMNGHECYIIGAGDFFGLREIPDDSDYVIAADAGFEYCRQNCIIPDMVLGDFDSLGQVPKHPNVVRLPIEKDDTDTMYALKLGLEKGYERFYIYGGLGGARPDHTMANLQSLLYLANRGARGWLFGEKYIWTAIKNTSLKIEGQGDVSLFCLDGAAEGVTIKGLKYEVDKVRISSDFPLGVSNSFVSPQAEISVEDGALLIMYDIKVNEID